MPPRKSKRVKTDTFLESGSSSIAEASLPNKSASRVESESGKKQNVYNPFEGIPLDVLGEILSHLEPLDLLHLARTSKQLRRELINPTSKVLWKRSAATVEDLPPCPKDMSDPQYADFMFSFHCQSCFRDDATIYTFMDARVQLCAECSLVEFKRWKDLPEAVDEALSNLVPSTTERLTKEEQRMTNSQASTGKKIRSRLRFHAKSAMALHKEFSKLESEEEKAAWLEQQSAIWHEIEKHAEACSRFVYIQREKEVARGRRLREQRKEQIHKKLIDLGWGLEFVTYPQYRDVPHGPNGRDHVDEQRELTEQEWDEIKDEMIKWMEEVKVLHTERERQRRFRNRVYAHIAPAYSLYVSGQPPNSWLPTLAEVVMVLLPLLEDIPDDQDLPEGTFDAILAGIPQIIADWKEKSEETLLDIIRMSGDHLGPISREILPYASTTFQCRYCYTLLTYPAIGNHPCLFRELYKIHRKRKLLKNSPHAEGDPEQSLAKDFFWSDFGDARVWYPSSAIVFYEPGYRHTVAALDVLGLEHTTTAEVLLQRLNPYMKCLCECYHPPPRVAMRVSQALSMCHHHPSGTFEGSFATISEESLKRHSGYKENSQSYDMYCIWCRDRPDVMQEHLVERHDMGPAEAATNERKHRFLARTRINDTRIYIPPYEVVGGLLV